MQVRPLTSFSQDLSDEGWRPGSRVLDVDVVEADADLARNLRLAPGAPVHRVARLRTQGRRGDCSRGRPPAGPLAAPGGGLPARGSLYRTMTDKYGIDLDAVEDIVETTQADPVTANLIGIEVGLPLLLVHRTAWNADGRPSQWTRSLFRGDKFRFVARQRLDDTDHMAFVVGQT